MLLKYHQHPLRKCKCLHTLQKSSQFDKLGHRTKMMMKTRFDETKCHAMSAVRSTNTWSCICIYIYIFFFIYLFIDWFTYLFIHFLQICIYIYVCVCVCVYAYIYIYICTECNNAVMRNNVSTYISMHVCAYHVYLLLVLWHDICINIMPSGWFIVTHHPEMSWFLA